MCTDTSSYHVFVFLYLEVERQSLFGSPPRQLHLPHDRGSLMAIDPYTDTHERMREERLTRILRMERELSVLRAREGDVLDAKPSRPPLDPHDRDIFYRRSPGPHPSLSASGYQSSYLRERESGNSYGSISGGGVSDRSRYYGGNTPPREYTTRGFSGNAGSGSYRDPVSYPAQFSSSGSGGYGSRGTPSVGYGHVGSGTGNSKSGLNSSLPPGWPSSDKPIVNRPPFSVGGPWS